MTAHKRRQLLCATPHVFANGLRDCMPVTRSCEVACRPTETTHVRSHRHAWLRYSLVDIVRCCAVDACSRACLREAVESPTSRLPRVRLHLRKHTASLLYSLMYMFPFNSTLPPFPFRCCLCAGNTMQDVAHVFQHPCSLAPTLKFLQTR
jgi:hypothetical protein